MCAGTLYIVATPIGNLADLTTRARDTLASVDHILAEDTRRARVLLSHIGVKARPVSLHAHNEAGRVERVRRWLSRGDDVALVSDAGTPLLSDPGERVLRAAVDDGHTVVPLPGPSAILAGLVASGLPCVPFTFVGFPPRKAGARARALERIIDARETTVLFEAPGRLVQLLEELAGLVEGAGGEGCGSGPGAPRRIAVCREMTKVHEEVFRGTPAEGVRHYAENPPRGEVTVVIEGRPAGAGMADVEDVDREAATALADGLAPTAAAKRVARGTGVSRRDAYEAVMRAKRGKTGAGGPA